GHPRRHPRSLPQAGLLRHHLPTCPGIVLAPLRSGKTDAIDAAAAAQAVLSGRATATAKTSVGRHQARWNLAADSTELATLDDLAGACPEQTVTYEPAG
ncbi:hypothetical protein AB0O86_29945, partial [Streptomyces hirsutus]